MHVKRLKITFVVHLQMFLILGQRIFHVEIKAMNEASFVKNGIDVSRSLTFEMDGRIV